jgi:hypothetical protein
MPKENNRPIGGISPNLVTLIESSSLNSDWPQPIENKLIR